MKRLFMVRDSKGKAVMTVTKQPLYLADKGLAKQVRDEENRTGVGYHVALGPDHMGYHGQGRVPRMRRQPKHTRGES